mmetsp:Transcript_15073/g.20974  ORF Transcript_15073/g.20974 Transcript_15073/m.20974 type:complete len:117 (+) Transcript_15073:104-454(+)
MSIWNYRLTKLKHLASLLPIVSCYCYDDDNCVLSRFAISLADVQCPANNTGKPIAAGAPTVLSAPSAGGATFFSDLFNNDDGDDDDEQILSSKLLSSEAALREAMTVGVRTFITEE